MEKLRDSLAVKLSKPINPSLIVILGLYTVLWGLWILSPFWTVFTQAPVYCAMALIMPETCWGILATLAGLFIIKGAVSEEYSKLILGSMVSFLHWLTIAILYFAADWQNTGGITCIMLAAYSAIVWINIKINYK